KNFIVGIIESYSIKTDEEKDIVVEPNTNETDKKNNENKIIKTKSFILNIQPIGTLSKENKKTKFQRGFRNIPIPPVDDIKLVSPKELEEIYNCNLKDEEKFIFSKLSQGDNIKVPVNGNRFFNKHIAIVGATGSGKSHTTAKIIQNAVALPKGRKFSLNNSHIIVFDIHSEYGQAFPDANIIDINQLTLPYWLLTSEELIELFIDTEANDHNQRNVFKEAVISSRKKHFEGSEIERDKIHFDSSRYFDIHEVLQHAVDKNTEMIQGTRGLKQGSLYGRLENFVSRLENKLNDKRFEFLFGEKCKKITFEETLKQFTSYGFRKQATANVTILDLSGIPFEVLSITVSLISRMLFEFGYYYKKIKKDTDIPILLVFEEAHKYVPQSNLAKYRASKHSIERIAKEGRKYGVSLLIASQRPSEVSTTIFAQCNNFIAMRLTNPDDQNYVKKLLPDTLGGLTDNLSVLRTGEALLIGDAVEIPSIVQIDRCKPEPSSSDIPYLEKWSEQWFNVDFEKIIKNWEK
ncbi:MAG: ATP-binding protein, partial [Bacteroidota bacterium]|nr:ATP-binding protein [Bacteroidota bacterium]